MLTRRLLLAGSALGIVGAATFLRRAPAQQMAAAATTYPVAHTEAEWRKMLSPKAYSVLREADTEYPGTSPLLNEHRKGTFDCAGCALPLFASDTKFESGTGWPSFYAPLPNAVATEDDHTFGMDRTAVHCVQCGGHLGHVFDDGPKPTGLRYCMNGVAMTFKPASA